MFDPNFLGSILMEVLQGFRLATLKVFCDRGLLRCCLLVPGLEQQAVQYPKFGLLSQWESARKLVRSGLLVFPGFELLTRFGSWQLLFFGDNF